MVLKESQRIPDSKTPSHALGGRQDDRWNIGKFDVEFVKSCFSKSMPLFDPITQVVSRDPPWLRGHRLQDHLYDCLASWAKVGTAGVVGH